MTPTMILDRLRDDLCLPVAADVPPEQAAAWWRGALVLVRCTGRVAADVFGWTGRAPVHLRHVGVEALPTAGLDALAVFLDHGMHTLGADAHDDVVAAIEAERADMIVTLRPDRGSAAAHLVDRDDIARPILLFALHAVEPVTH